MDTRVEGFDALGSLLARTVDAANLSDLFWDKARQSGFVPLLDYNDWRKAKGLCHRHLRQAAHQADGDQIDKGEGRRRDPLPGQTGTTQQQAGDGEVEDNPRRRLAA